MALISQIQISLDGIHDWRAVHFLVVKGLDSCKFDSNVHKIFFNELKHTKNLFYMKKMLKVWALISLFVQ